MNTMNYISSDRFYDAYIELLTELMNDSNTKSPRGQKVNYFQNCLFHVEHPGDVFDCDTRPYPKKYLNEELKLYFSGTLSAEEFGKASKFWLNLKNPDGWTINSNYGYLIFHKEIENRFNKIKNQWTWAKTKLLEDKDTRQAVMFLSSPHVQFNGNKDFICTLNYTFSIDENRLNFTVNRRSQDVILGLTFDYAWEYILMLKMCNELKETYSELEIGSYTMFCNNIHVYERNFDLVKNMIKDDEENKARSMKVVDIVDQDVFDKYVNSNDFWEKENVQH